MMMQFNSVSKFRNSVIINRISNRKKTPIWWVWIKNNAVRKYETAKLYQKNRTCDVWRIFEWIRYETSLDNTNSHRESGDHKYTYLQHICASERMLNGQICAMTERISRWHSYNINKHFSSVWLSTATQQSYIFIFHCTKYQATWCLFDVKNERIPNTKTMTRVSVYSLRILNLRCKHTHAQTHIQPQWLDSIAIFLPNIHRSSDWKVFRSFFFSSKDHFHVCLVWYTSDQGHAYFCGSAKMNDTNAHICCTNCESQVFSVCGVCVLFFCCCLQHITII